MTETETPCRIPETFNGSLADMAFILAGGNLGALSVLSEWAAVDPRARMGFLTSLDLKHLYDEHIWEVYKLCGRDIHRFIYHVSMELPNQYTGKLVFTGPYCSRVRVDEGFFAKRTFGKPGSYWALEHPPTDTDYDYPIL